MNLLKNIFGPKPNTIYKSITEGNLAEIQSYFEETPDLKSDFQSESILHYAIDNCENNYFEIINFLIDNGIDINNHQSRLQETPLHRLCARVSPRMDLIELLLKKGADVNALNKAGKTPLFYCSFNFSPELLRLLVRYGADINIRDKYGSTLLHDDYINCEDEHFEDFLKTLLDLGFDINAKNPAGLTPLNFCENKKFENILKKYGADKSSV